MNNRGANTVLGWLTRFARGETPQVARKRRLSNWEAWVWRATAAASLSALVLAATVMTFQRDGLLHLAVLDVGQGDATLLTDPVGRHALINGGPNPNAIAVHMGERMPPWNRRLDLLVVTSLRQDELAGATSIVSRYRPPVAFTPAGGTGPSYQEWLKQTALVGVQVREITEPITLDVGQGARLELLPVEPSSATKNAAVLAVRVVYGDSDAVLAGNLSVQDQQWLVDTNAPITGTLLVLPRNGGAQTLAPDFLQSVDPHVAVISTGRNNRASAPSDDTVHQLGDMPVYRTDEAGTLEFVSDGHEWAQR